MCVRFARYALGVPAVAGAVLLAGTVPALPHAFGARYDLPLPLELYLIGAGAAVALSFVVMALVFRTHPADTAPPWGNLSTLAPIRALAHPVSMACVKAVSAGLFLVILAAGFFGTQDADKNIAPAFIWIIWWVGLAYVAALIGNPWPVINPWSVVYAGLVRVVRLFRPTCRPDFGVAYPSWLGAWPAVILFGLFAWFELISESATVPATLALAIAVYSGITWLGMAAFGRPVWLANGEAFSLAFSVFGRFAPIGPADQFSDNEQGALYFRPYAGALIVSTSCGLSMTVFVLTMLATVTFDGVKETPFWSVLLRWIALAPALHAPIRTVHDLGFDFHVVIETVVMALFPALFLAIFLIVSWLVTWAAGQGGTVIGTAGLFVWSLVPIAVAYHLAHYLAYLLVAGQMAIPLASDPFGLGWNLFGTAGYRTNIGIIGAETIWYAVVVAIVAGHVFAVGVAHFIALNVFSSFRAAIRSQYPMLLLMIGYTMLSLWILAQPIVGSPSQSKITAPSGTLTLAPFEIREFCLELSAADEIRYNFKSDHPIEFNVHYHDGLAIHYKVELSRVTAHASKFVADHDRTYCLFLLNQGLTTASLTYAVSGP